MEVKKSDMLGGSLQISTDVIAKISRLAALEIEGIQDVTCGASAVRGAFAKASLQKPVEVVMNEDVAQITVSIIVKYGYKIPSVCESIQKNIKASVQNMTGITVSKVNIVVVGVAIEPQSSNQE